MRKKEDNLDFLADVILPDEKGERGVFIVSGADPKDFFVIHSAIPRNLRAKVLKDSIRVKQSVHLSSRHLLDLKRLLGEIKEKENIRLRKEAAEEFIAGTFSAAASKQKSAVKFGRPKFNFGLKKLLKKIPRYGFNFSPAVGRGLAAFALVAAVFILPIKAFTFYGSVMQNKNQIIDTGLAGFDHFKRGLSAMSSHSGSALGSEAQARREDPSGSRTTRPNGGQAVGAADFTTALLEFRGAEESFAAAENSLGQIGGVANRLLALTPFAGKFLKSGQDLSSLGENLSLAALDLTRGFAAFKTEDNWVARLGNLQNYIDAALPRLAAAESALQSLKDNLPAPLTLDQWELLNSAVGSVKSGLTEVKEAADLAAELLGRSGRKRYLVIFQNSTELRPTGGFMGSFGLLDVSRGEVKNLEIPGGGTYDLKGQLRELLIPPKPLGLIASSWQFQDANWFPDWPASAKKIMWFYEHSGGPTVDGVIAINSSLVQKLLQFSGPIPMPEYGKIIAADNFMDETQAYVELLYDKTENKPKQIIADLAPLLIEKLKMIGEGDLGNFFSVLSRAVSAKDIQIYLTDTALEDQVRNLGLDGALYDAGPATDYLLVVDTNIAGQKTDGMIDELIDETIDISPDGTIDKTLKITRSHRGIKGALFSGVRNVDYLRLYVPEGSIFLGAEGFTAPSSSLFKAPTPGAKDDADLKSIESEYFTDPLSGTRVGGEFGKTVFAGWIMVDPGRSVTVTVKYRLPFKFRAKEPEGILARVAGAISSENFLSYQEIIQKQSGANNTLFRSQLNLPADCELVARYPANLGAKENGWQIETGLNGDKFFGILLRD